MQRRAGISLYLQAFLNTRWLYSFTQVKKALELYEQLRQRMGVVVIGPSGSGKSTIWRLLRLALGKVGQTVKHYTMNPKAMPRTQVGVMLKHNLLSNNIVALLLVVKYSLVPVLPYLLVSLLPQCLVSNAWSQSWSSNLCSPHSFTTQCLVK